MTHQNTDHEGDKKPASERSSRRGFASMDPQQQRAIASKGGKAAHARGAAHEFDSREAAEAGRKGGQVVSRDRKHMAQIGAEGGRARALAQKARAAAAAASKAPTASLTGPVTGSATASATGGVGEAPSEVPSTQTTD